MYSYIIWLTIFVWLPLAILWSVYPFVIQKYWKIVFSMASLSCLGGIPWDLWAVHKGIWYWTAGKTIGLSWLVLPLEEYLFIFFVPMLVATLTIIFYKKLKQ